MRLKEKLVWKLFGITLIGCRISNQHNRASNKTIIH